MGASRRILYNRMKGFGTPRWDKSITPPEVVAVIEGGTAIPSGSALDLGCGTGPNVIYLARHGWKAVGVDFSPVAIQQARRLAKDTPGATFVQGDVSQLSRLGIDGPFDFVLDIGCYHGLPANARQDYAREVGRVNRPGALFTIWAIASDRWPFLPGAPAMQDKEIAGRFGGSLLGIDPDAPEPALPAWSTGSLLSGSAFPPSYRGVASRIEMAKKSFTIHEAQGKVNTECLIK